MIKKVAAALVVFLALFAVFVATRPSAFKIERSTAIAASPNIVFNQLADFHLWPAWSPWEGLDPQMKRTYGGADSGVGASYAWSGNDKVGEGRMTVTDARPPERLEVKLEFLKPWQAVNTATFLLTPADGTTKVTWSMTGENNFGAKAFGLFVDMDKLVGADFERGLAKLKTVAEAQAKKLDTIEDAPAAGAAHKGASAEP